jgi:hypothetical protein
MPFNYSKLGKYMAALALSHYTVGR